MTSSGSKNKTGLIIGIVCLALVVAGVGFYIYVAQKYNDCFLPGTTINGVEAGERTAEDVESEIAEACSDFQMIIKSRQRADEVISSSDVDLHYYTGEAVLEILDQQNKYEWLIKKFLPDDYRITTTTKIDEDKFDTIVGNLKCFDIDTAISPVPAHISEYDEDNGYQVVPSTTGNVITDKQSAVKEIKSSFLSLEPEFDMENNNGHLYDVPYIDEDNSELQAICDKANAYTKTNITYTGYDLVLDGATVSRMLSFGEDDVVINDRLVNAFVRVLADTYDTYGKDHLFKSTWGDDVVVEGGNFGWQIDQVAEYKQIVEDINAGNVVEREPVFLRKGVSFGRYDYGDTYVEVNLTAQHMYYYKDGHLILHSNFVSGKDTKDRRTPQGAYSVFFKQTDRILRGEKQPDGTYEYESHVNYWMPFNKGIGLHDATWRSSFGGNIWKYNGSHGCINLPLKTAKSLYASIDVGCPVICYFLEGSKGEAPNAPEVWVDPDAVEETTKAKTKTETKPAATKPAAEDITVATETPAQETVITESGAEATEPETSTTVIDYGPGGAVPTE